MILLSLGILRGTSLAGSADSLSEAVLGVQKRYAGVESIYADFRQNYRGPGIEQNEAGRLWMRRPGLMRWEYTEPERKFFIADGRDTYLYTPEDRQVLVRSFSAEEMRNTPLYFLLGQAEILRSFIASWEKEFRRGKEDALLLRLVPRAPDPEYSFVVIECEPGSYELRRLIIREPSGNTSEFVFTNIRMNLKVDKKQFQFKVPKGVEIVRLDEK